MEFGTFYQYKDGTLAAVSEPAEQEVKLAVADSFLVEDGSMRAKSAHEVRFTAGIKEIAPDYLKQLPGYFDSAFALIPKTGRWFPRFELHLGAESPNQLFLRLRPAPEPAGPAILWTLPETDPRSNPAVKGPDLSLGQQLRRKAKMYGADEAVLLDSNGHISEGALSSMVWWQGDALCAPSDDVRWLPSITRNLVLDIARQSGIEVRLVEAKPEELAGCEIWLLSALNGIRPVSGWIGLDIELGQPTHLDSFSKRLRLYSQQLA